MRTMGGVMVAVVVLGLQCMGWELVAAQAGGGWWSLLLNNSGVSSMHTAVTRYNTVIFLDQTDIGPTNLTLANGVCRNQPLDRILPGHDCWAHSAMFRTDLNTVRPLFIFTDTWCSSGQFFSDGTLWQTGGDYEGNQHIRSLTPCPSAGTCDWVQQPANLSTGRWYSTNHILPEGNRMIVMGGRDSSNYEFVPTRTPTEGSFLLPFFADNCCDNLYPFVFLLPNGQLFIFTNMNSIMFNYINNTVTKTLPTIPENPRNYPSGGSAVLLPLHWQANFTDAEVLICGGAALHASQYNNVSAPCSASCGRIQPLAANSTWAMENMPIGRCMGDMVLMPDQTVLIINGAQTGFQGWGKASNPALVPVSYNPNATLGSRFTEFATGSVPRMYHSTANLLADGRVLCAGSNPHQYYTYTGAFPTELRIDAFSPPYLGEGYNHVRPKLEAWPKSVKYNQVFQIAFYVRNQLTAGGVQMVQRSSPFTTHTFSQGQRMLVLSITTPVAVPNQVGIWACNVTSAPSPVVAPPQYYLFFIVNLGIPGRGRWIPQTN